jgi:hypothetical protein
MSNYTHATSTEQNHERDSLLWKPVRRGAAYRLSAHARARAPNATSQSLRTPQRSDTHGSHRRRGLRHRCPAGGPGLPPGAATPTPHQNAPRAKPALRSAPPRPTGAQHAPTAKGSRARAGAIRPQGAAIRPHPAAQRRRRSTPDTLRRCTGSLRTLLRRASTGCHIRPRRASKCAHSAAAYRAS